ncbi:MAG: Nif3-like dinuclear metal center hexameric protein [Spirochaetes bacterium RBG_13_51_14]|nr:MAG: Nif3-like dinuclear metal center hexameric protein [Spirochaetes bacterium RBG_13_51_14]
MFGGMEVRSILIALDIDRSVVEEAIRKKCQLILVHHPVFFHPVTKIDASNPASSLLIDIIDKRISVYAAHTNLDKLYYDKLATVLGLHNTELLYPAGDMKGSSQAGYGVISRLDEPVPLISLLDMVRSKLNLDFLVYAGDPGIQCSRIAVLNGAGGRFIEDAIAEHGADCVITGDVGHHQAKYASVSGAAVIDAGHFGTEVVMLGFLRDQIADCLTNTRDGKDIRIDISESEQNPMSLFSRTDNE